MTALCPDSLRNVRMMHLLERIGRAFNEAGVPLMALKGAALNLALYERPDERTMLDLDLMVRSEDLERAQPLLEQAGCLRSDIVFREDFFPKYYYEIEYTAGTVDPVLIDLHVRPFRLLRYARFMPDDALWRSADAVSTGGAEIMVPSAEDMLIHLAGHSAIHDNCRVRWLQDIKRWVASRRGSLDWRSLLDRVAAWHLALPVRSALDAAEAELGPFCPAPVRPALAKIADNWRDRLALWHAPRDGEHLARSFLVNLLTTPGTRFKLGYVRDVLVPDRAYMDDWQDRHDGGRRGWAHVRRCLAPVVRRLPRPAGRYGAIEVRRSGIHGMGVYAKRDVRKGEFIARYRGRPVDRYGTYVACHKDAAGREQRVEITGPLRYLNHKCRPNAELVGFKLRALRPIRAGHEVTIDYGGGTCTCQGEKENAEA